MKNKPDENVFNRKPMCISAAGEQIGGFIQVTQEHYYEFS